MRMRAYLIGMLYLLPLSAEAGNRCTFQMACIEDKPCAPTAFAVSLRAGTGGPDDIELHTGDEIVGVAVGGNSSVAHIAGMSPTGFHVLTLEAATGKARYTWHVDEGLRAVTYHGTCEVDG